MSEETTMRIDPCSALPASRQSWRMCLGQGRAAELLRGDVLAHLRMIQQEIGFRYLRFHGLFHEEMSVVSRRGDGSLCFHWHMVDGVFDAMRDLGLKPFVELGPMPQALASGGATIFHWKMNVSPPRDFSEWGLLVRELALHCVRRYGLHEVRSWYFEVWNEPNLSGFWSGSQSDYFELYRAAASALKGVDPALRVGGPATAQAAWIPDLIGFCSSQGVPIDFVSTHSYLQDEQTFYPGRQGSPHLPSEYLLDQFRRVRAEVGASSRPDLEIHWTEWNSLSAGEDGQISWTENPRVDSLYSGSFALHQAVRADGLCDSLSWWAASDIFGEDGISPLAYSSTYGLVSSLGLPKPAFHVFKWLSRMGGERLAVLGAPDDQARQILVTREGGCVRALLWHHLPVGSAAGPWRIGLELDLPWPALMTSARLTARGGGGFEAWKSWGMPATLTPAQEDSLRAACTPEHETRLCEAGSAIVRLDLHPWEVVFLEWCPSEAPASRRGVWREDSLLETHLAGVTKTGD